MPGGGAGGVGATLVAVNVGWSVAALVVAVACYTAATLLLADAATRGRTHGAGSALGHTLRQPAWWLATALQGVAFVVLLGARHLLPLMIVQPAVTSALATTTVAGALLGRWTLTGRDVAAVTLVITGLALAAAVARPGQAQPLEVAVVVGLVLVQMAAVAVLLAGARLPAIVTGMGAGLAFGSAALAGRAWAAEPFGVLERSDVLAAAVLTVIGTVLGQLLLSVALGTGRVGGPVAGMYAVQTSAPALAGVLLLGDRLAPHGAPVATVGVLVAVVASLLLARHGVPEPEESARAAPVVSGPGVRRSH